MGNGKEDSLHLVSNLANAHHTFPLYKMLSDAVIVKSREQDVQIPYSLEEKRDFALFFYKYQGLYLCDRNVHVLCKPHEADFS